MVSYCGTAHQSTHRPKHKADCNAIKKRRECYELEETALRTHLTTPTDVFQTGVGYFWDIEDTRAYMRARFALANALLRIDNTAAITQALEHFLDMMRLNPSDNLGVRDIMPHALLRLGLEQACYDFLRWSAIDLGTDPATSSAYSAGADAFEPLDTFRSGEYVPSLSQLVALTLLKLRLYLDLLAVEGAECDFPCDYLDDMDEGADRPMGDIVGKELDTMDAMELPDKVQALKGQYHELCRSVYDANPHFWGLLVDKSFKTPAPPASSEAGSIEEAHLTLYQCKRAWEESEDAIMMINADTAALAPVYDGPTAAIPTTNATSRSSGTTQAWEKRRGSGKVFPSIFDTPRASCLADLFSPVLVARDQTNRFISRNDRKRSSCTLTALARTTGNRTLEEVGRLSMDHPLAAARVLPMWLPGG